MAKNVLVFAAASNYGNMKRNAFPGRMRNSVFCIYATDARARVATSSQSFNPPGLKNCNNFAILGEGIHLGPWGSSVSGTSYSTSIAAGLAARILDFSRQRHPASVIRKSGNLQSFEGMSAVFERLVGNPDSKSDYQCLRPWKVIEIGDDDETKEQKRQRICDIISLALEESS